ncbi:MAG: hypothetical protein K5739_09365 [Lachnospiraceae bacterium]|nr:hypothetical protein [Lachnospiraceae bacterium]
MKYTVKVKSENKPVKGLQLKLKIQKKIYKAKTNSKGVATFKIKTKKLKKGSSQATVSWKGNEKYKKTTKKVKVTVK